MFRIFDGKTVWSEFDLDELAVQDFNEDDNVFIKTKKI